MRKILSIADAGVEAAAQALVEALTPPGAVALVPTETVYGLVAKVGDKAGYERIFELKQRSPQKVLGWFVGDWRKLTEYGVILEGLPEQLCSCYFPGALTVIARCKDGSTLGFRSPDFPLLQAALPLTGPLYQTSANKSGLPNPLTLQEALAELSGEVDLAIDGGALPAGAQGSTVVDATGENIKILRQGAVKCGNGRAGTH